MMKTFAQTPTRRAGTLFLMLTIAVTAAVMAAIAAGNPQVLAAAPSNLEVVGIFPAHDPDTGDVLDDEYLAILNWDFDENDHGFWVAMYTGQRTSADGNICDFTGAYPRGKSEISIATLSGPNLEPGEWYFKVTSLRERNNSDVSVEDLTCDNQGQDFSSQGADIAGPVTVRSNNTPLRDLAAPTGFRVVSAEHRRVELEWDPPEDGATTGYVVRRKWLGSNDNTDSPPPICIWESNNSITPRLVDIYIGAYEDTGSQNQYEYKLFPINTNYDTGDSDAETCDTEVPASTPATVTATLEISDAFRAANGKLVLENVTAPRQLELTSRWRFRNPVGPQIKATWEGVDDAPAYQLRVKETSGDGTWLETFTRQARNHPNLFRADGTTWRRAKTYHRTTTTLLESITSGERYTYQVGTCDTLDCDNVTWNNQTRTVVAARRPE